jgi:WD40 repeat protein
MRTTHRSIRTVPLALCAVLSACAGDNAVATRNDPGLHFLTQPLADTIDAAITAPVELRLNDDKGQPRANVAVVVSGGGGPGLATSLGSSYRPSVTLTTDAAGEARAWVKLGGVAGRDLLRASAGEATDSLVIEVRAGQPVSIVATPADTAVWVGQTYPIRTQVRDRRNNLRTDPVAFAATGGAATVSSGGAVSATTIGRTTIVTSLGALTATIGTSVVPQAVLAVYVPPGRPGGDAGIYVIRSDGSDGHWVYRQAGDGPTWPSSLWPTWSGDGTRLAFIQALGLRSIGADGSGLRDLVSGGPPVSNGFAPQYAKDGWIYFSRVEGGGQTTCWRVRDDGSGLAQVSEKRSWGIEAMPTPNAFGDVVAYQTNDITNSPIEFTLRFISVSTGTIRKLDMRGYSPRWSPVGDRVAYLNGPDRLNFLDANGTPLGEVGGRAVALQQGFSWSPDGAWIVGVTSYPNLGAVLEMVNTTSGLVLPMNFHGPDGQELGQPSWRPR